MHSSLLNEYTCAVPAESLDLALDTVGGGGQRDAAVAAGFALGGLTAIEGGPFGAVQQGCTAGVFFVEMLAPAVDASLAPSAPAEPPPRPPRRFSFAPLLCERAIVAHTPRQKPALLPTAFACGTRILLTVCGVCASLCVCCCRDIAGI